MLSGNGKTINWFRLLCNRGPCKRTVFLSLCLCASLGFNSYLLHKDRDQVGPERLYSSSVQVGPNTNMDSSNGDNLGLTPALSTTTTMPHQWSDNEKALVDDKTKSVNDLVLEAAATIRNIPSVPYILGEDKDGPKYLGNSSCARSPTFYDLEFSNIYWQTLRTSNGTFHLYAAYFDIRHLNPLGPSLRILVIMERIEHNVTSFCQIWFEGENEPLISKVIEYEYIWDITWDDYKQGDYQPHLLACKVPPSHNGKAPTSVSLVQKPCDAATNNLRVLCSKPAKKKAFAVCVKGLDFIHEDISLGLVEWVELLGILGADTIYFHQLAVHPNVSKVLSYYQQAGRIHVTPLTLPRANDPRVRHIYLRTHRREKRLNELIPYNDCFYRNLYQYEYIALLDIDEVIMPVKGGGWGELMLEVDRRSRLTKNESRASYNFRQIRFVDDYSQRHERFQGIPTYLYMLQNVGRSQNYSELGVDAKCFHNPERVLTAHNHFPIACLSGSCTTYDVGTDLAQLQHYRQDCRLGLEGCTKEYRENVFLDKTIRRYKDELINRARKVLGHLEFIQILLET